jgi:predicted nucleic acid-binding protein
VLVVDASVVIGAITTSAHPVTELLAGDDDLHAPHLLDVEVDSALARLERHAVLEPGVVEAARVLFSVLPIERHAHASIADRAWEIRNNLSTYDASYVALAEALGAALVTSDRRLAEAPGNHADVVLVTA